ncbi:MAG: hypothetical protein AMJ79_08815 [Phycisphaerae bacterium SM23_30]|nr:MAG: hypothetical protein AMJ79_08815 [Phycisphaerae bacterium SM23_30]
MLILHARSVLSAGSPALPDGAVSVTQDRLAACGPYSQLRRQFPDAEVIDLNNCVLLPGLVNAHTHLELTPLKNRISYQGDFFDWVARLSAARRQIEGDLDTILTDAVRQCLKAGVTTVGDICFRHRAWRHLARQSIRKVCFAEVFGITAHPDAPGPYLEKCIAETQINPLLSLGLSPHAPYSAGPRVYQVAAQLAARDRLPLTTHLAETPDEVEFLTTGAGPCLDYLKLIHRWDGSFRCPRRSPVEYFLSLDLAHQPFLLAHVNYLNDDELHALSQTPHSVAYCPRSHQFFGHPQHPFQRLLAAGVNVCLGTDSLASNQTLSILDEIRFLHRHYPDFPAADLLKMATINAALALGLKDVGLIAPDYQADLIAMPIKQTPDDPLTDILHSDTEPVFTMVAGRVLHQIL